MGKTTNILSVQKWLATRYIYRKKKKKNTKIRDAEKQQRTRFFTRRLIMSSDVQRTTVARPRRTIKYIVAQYPEVALLQRIDADR